VETLRVKITGAVRKSSTSPERVTYDLLPPSSDLEESYASSINHGPLLPDPEIKLASQHKFPVSLTIERTKSQSAIYIREYIADGDQRYKPGTYLSITLKGAPSLFSSFDIPSLPFPPLQSYTEASVSHGAGGPKALDKVGSCATE
jgi:hypothetical protein